MRIDSHDTNANDSHGDRHDKTKAAGKAREHVVQDVAESGQATPQESTPVAQPKREDYHQEQPLEKTSGRHPGEVSPELGQDSGSAWQESQQMGRTGHGGVQNPQKNP